MEEKNCLANDDCDKMTVAKRPEIHDWIVSKDAELRLPLLPTHFFPHRFDPNPSQTAPKVHLLA